ncbi:MAG: glycosyltransferase [Candidatus Atribacteria bacterium]|nr:glycosyltransferase [Candidatus Atribacteria bacterium]
MKNVLIITYYFPPANSAGVFRTLKFAKYLGKFNYRVSICTPNPFFMRIPKDFKLLNEIPQDIKIYRTFILDLNWIFKLFYALRINFLIHLINNYLLFPDYQRQWLMFSKKKIKQILKNEKIDLVFISSPPHSLHLLSEWIKRKWFLPVVADFRDPFSFNFQKRSPKLFKKIMSLEEKILRVSDHIIANTSLNKENIIKNFNISENKISIIPNGFDPEDFTINNDSDKRTKYQKIVITHTGYFYDNYNAGYLLNIISTCNSQLKERIVLRFVGRLTPTDMTIIKEKNLDEIVEYIPFCPHYEAVNYMLSSNYLLLILPEKQSDFWIPSKTYEYLAAAKPIIAIIPENGVCAELIKNTASGTILDPSDSQKILNIFLNIANGEVLPYFPNYKEIEKYNRLHQTQILAETFNNLIGNNVI